ncbi:MAG: hypothetical protein IJS50_00655 [Desulfovibrio sp.]|nr:hypothetical protein [Desulfovibrio sp.]
MKIFITGTDSLSLYIASSSSLFDRNFTLHTTYISYYEWSNLLGIKNIDTYLCYGGLLSINQTDGESEHSLPLTWSDTERAEYFSSAISSNIQNTLRNYRDGERAGILTPFVFDDQQAMTSLVYGCFAEECRREFLTALQVLCKIDENIFSNNITIISCS